MMQNSSTKTKCIAALVDDSKAFIKFKNPLNAIKITPHLDSLKKGEMIWALPGGCCVTTADFVAMGGWVEQSPTNLKKLSNQYLAATSTPNTIR